MGMGRALLATAILGCSSSSMPSASVSSCTLTIFDVKGGMHPSCTDYPLASSPVIDSYRYACHVVGGGDEDAGGQSPLASTFSLEPCPQTGVVAHCALTAAATTITTWYYDTIFIDSQRMACEQNGGTWFTP